MSCGGAQGDDDGGGETGGTSGASTGGSTQGGSAGSGQGGSTGGSAGTTPETGGTSSGGTSGSGGDECPAKIEPQTCSGAPVNMHKPADGLVINFASYNTSSGNWGDSAMGDLTGGTSKYNGRDVSPISVALEGDGVRLTASIPPYTPDVADDAENYAGLVFWFGPCIDASAFTGVSFTAGGSMGGAALRLQVQTAQNYPADPANMKGECIYESCEDRWSECKGPDALVSVPEAPEEVTMAWDAFAEGSPNATVDPSGLVGLQFQLECQSQEAACEVDITLGNVTFTE